MSASLMALGGANCLEKLPSAMGTAEGARVGCPSAAGIWRPGWLICIQIWAPPLLAASAQALKRPASCGDSSGESSTTPPAPVMAWPSTITLPVMMRPVPPSAQVR
ncbi:hypothetical protein D3C75_857450 [compost metagenome]